MRFAGSHYQELRHQWPVSTTRRNSLLHAALALYTTGLGTKRLQTKTPEEIQSISAFQLAQLFANSTE